MLKLVRSNPVMVKDIDAFLAWAQSRDLEALEVEDVDGDRRFVLVPGPGRDQERLFASLYISEESIAICSELAAHLAEDEVAFVYHLGNDATWITAKGHVNACDLETVYRLAGERLNGILKPRPRTIEDPDPDDWPRQVVVAFGSEICEALEDHRPIGEKCGGYTKAITFQTEGEMEAFFTGVEFATGMLRYVVVADSLVGHLFFEAQETDRGLDYKDWYNQYLKSPDSFYLGFPPGYAS